MTTKKYNKGRRQQDKSIAMVDKLRLLDEYLPAVQEYVNKGGTVESFLRHSVPVAYARLAALVMGDDSALAFKASVEILNRALGKPVEKKQVLYADINDVPEKQIDAEILKALKKDPKLIDGLIDADEKRAAEPKEKQTRKPKMIDLDGKES